MTFLNGMLKFHRTVFIFAIILYCFTAYYSNGYYHADEHYQIIEFAGAKLGTNLAHEQAWEFKAMSRQAIQPAIVYVIFRVLEVFHISDPYTKVFILRLLTAILALVIIQFFVKTRVSDVDDGLRKPFILISYFLWFLPAINVRFSSESWSGLMFLLALSIIQSKKLNQQNMFLMLGSILGLGFLFRFQSIFLSVGLVCWLLFIRKISWKNMLHLALSGAVVLIIGILIDCWFYGKFVITFLEYFNKQIIEDIASDFGTEAWYYYLKEIIMAPIWPIGAITAFAFLMLLLNEPRNILIWSIIPFVLVHFIPHKEVRFLFPLVNLVPIILVSGLQQIRFNGKILWFNRFLKPVVLVVIVLSFIVNVIGLAAFSSKPAGNGKMEISRYIADKFHEKPVRLIHCSWSSPYNPFESVPTKFYQRSNIEEVRILSLCQLNDSLLSDSKENLIVLRQIELKSKRCQKVLESFTVVERKRSIPFWIEKLSRFYPEMNSDDVLILYSIR
jgi:phosphatidylinositol glycan class B